MQAPVENAGEPAVGDERDVLAPGQVPERRRDLRGLLHAGARRPRADQDDDVALAHRSAGDVPLTAWIASRSSVNTRAGPRCR